MKKQSNEYVKLLQDGHIKKEYANQTSRLHKEIKVYEKKVKEEEELALAEYSTREQKMKRIIEMEHQLSNLGVSGNELLNLRKKFEASKERSKSTI
jgi:uncharacterized protein YbjQ (UPF0145 family)